MKDKTKAEKETTKQKSNTVYMIKPDDNEVRITSLELLCSSHSALLSDQKGRIIALELDLDTNIQELNNKISYIESYLSKVGLDGVKHELTLLKENIDNQKIQMEFFYNAIANLYNETRMPLNESKDYMKRTDEMIGEFSKSQSSQYVLINQKIERIYQELQPLAAARGLDLDMKKIVDGLEQTVHDLDEKFAYRCLIVEATVENYKRQLDAYTENSCRLSDEFYKGRKLTNILIPSCLLIGLGAFTLSIASFLKYMFF